MMKHGTGAAVRARRLTTAVISIIAALALSVALVPVASAQVTPPSNTLTNFNDTGGTFTFNGFNGGTSNVAAVAPGSSNTATSTLVLPDLNSGNFYTAPLGIIGTNTVLASYPSDCAYGFGSGGSDVTWTSTFTAPTTAGIYYITADLGPNFTCQDSWHADTGNPAVAVLVVTSFDSVCSLAQSYSTDPAVAAGLCDKLTAAKAAADRGNTKAEANILAAFNHEVAAQTGKALTSDQADTLSTLVYYLNPSA